MQPSAVNEGSEPVRRALVASLVSGIAHDLNGRLGALLGVAHLARTASPMEEDLLRVLDEQIGRLRDAVGLLRAIPLTDLRRELRPIPLSDAVMSAIRLYRCRSGPDLAAVVAEPEGETAIVTVAPPAFIEGLLLVLAAAERGAGGRSCPVRVTWGAADGGNRVRVERDGPAPGEEEPILGGADETDVLHVAGLRTEAGGARLTVRGPGVFEVDLA